MTNGLGTGLLAAVAAAGCYGAAPVVQGMAARRAPVAGGFGLLFVLRLARRPLWLAGLVGEIGGFLLEAYAFSVAPTALVAPVLAFDMVVFVVLCRWAFGARLGLRGWLGVAGIAVAVAVLAVAFAAGEQLGDPASTAILVWFGIASVLAGAVAAGIAARLRVGSRPLVAAGVFSVAAGAAYGLATLSTRQVGRTFSVDDPWHLLATPTPYVLAVCSIVGIVMMQRALQTRPVLAFPVVSAMGALLPVILGVTLFNDEIPGGTGRFDFVIALLLLVGGVGLLGADRSRAEHAAADGRGEVAVGPHPSDASPVGDM
jgi:multidrug transporter EmrE-like cation transporter